MNETFCGDELCPYCNMETGFSFNPMKDNDITCEHCGAHIMPCSLCDCDIIECSNGDCISNIRKSLIYYNLNY